MMDVSCGQHHVNYISSLKHIFHGTNVKRMNRGHDDLLTKDVPLLCSNLRSL